MRGTLLRLLPQHSNIGGYIASISLLDDLFAFLPLSLWFTPHRDEANVISILATQSQSHPLTVLSILRSRREDGFIPLFIFGGQRAQIGCGAVGSPCQRLIPETVWRAKRWSGLIELLSSVDTRRCARALTCVLPVVHFQMACSGWAPPIWTQTARTGKAIVSCMNNSLRPLPTPYWGKKVISLLVCPPTSGYLFWHFTLYNFFINATLVFFVRNILVYYEHDFKLRRPEGTSFI